MAWYREHGAWPTADERHLITEDLVRAHDAILASCWDAAVEKGDVVWVLGDLIANARSFDYSLDWYNKRPGTKHLVLGNHDPGHPMHSEAHKWDAKYYRAFESVATVRTRRITMPDGSKQKVLLSHFPYNGDGELKEDRDTQFRLRNEGLPILHGHVHSKEVLTFSSMGPAEIQVPQVHVGVDAWDYEPVSLDEIVGVLTSSTGSAYAARV